MDVKVGDKIVVSSGHIPDRIGAITRVTNAGSFAVDCCGEALFDKNGRLKGAGVWDTTHAYLATEEDIERVRREKVIRGVCQMCNKLKTTDITYDQAVAVWDILVNNA